MGSEPAKVLGLTSGTLSRSLWGRRLAYFEVRLRDITQILIYPHSCVFVSDSVRIGIVQHTNSAKFVAVIIIQMWDRSFHTVHVV